MLLPSSSSTPKPSPILQTLNSNPKSPQFPKSPAANPPPNHVLRIPKIASLLNSSLSHLKNPLSCSCQSGKPPFDAFPFKSPLFLTISPFLLISSPSFAAETEQISSSKINIEAILVSIDDFFNRNPFFVAGCTFIWLVVVPLTQEYLKKYKPISAIDAFRKLKDLPNCQLLDIRKEKSVLFMEAPNLKSYNKHAVNVEFKEGNEEGFVKEVLLYYREPANTVICVLDNFDGNSLKVAELLHNNGFKEAYAIKGGVRGKDGWQAIQKTLLPPSVRVYPRKSKKILNAEVNGQSTSEPNILKTQTSTPSASMEGSLNPSNGNVNTASTSNEEVTF